MPEGNLPIPLSALLGRARELHGVGEALRTTRLVTVAGPGGVGKTRLALEVARRRPARGHGVWLVDLASGPSSPEVAAETASAIGVQTGRDGSPADALRRYLANRDVLLVLDNCEHVVEACAQLADDLLGACAGVRILATSREPLGVTGETVWRLEPLEPDFASRLFVERARRRQPEFQPNAEADAIIADLCERLDRLPLAIELAAGRMSMMTPAEILAGVEASLEVLGGGERRLPAHHRTVRAAIEWSVALLDEIELHALRDLAVFAGSFDAAAASAVAPDATLDVLGRLVDKSLVAVATSARGRTRYRLLETVREYALELLASSDGVDAATDRHLRHFAGLGDAALQEWLTTGRQQFVNEVEDDYENVRRALEHALESDPCVGLDMFAGLRDLFFRFGQSEGVRLGLLLLESCRARDAHRIAGQIAAGQLALSVFDLDRAGELLAEARRLSSELDERALEAWALHFLGIVATFAGDLADARELLASSRAFHRELGIRIGEVRALVFLGLSSLAAGDPDSARAFFEEGLAIATAEEDAFGHGQCEMGLGNVADATGAGRANASAHYARAVEMLMPLREATLLPASLVGQAAVLAETDPKRALEVAAGATAIRARSGGRFPPMIQERVDRVRRIGESSLGSDIEMHWNRGLRLDAEALVALAFGGERPRPAAPAGLSAREVEVSRLVSEGLSNKEIAARLHLSVRTVESHVRNSLAKTGLENRTQLAAWARDRI